MLNNSAYPEIAISKLLKSCATPPASRPTLSRRCAYRLAVFGHDLRIEAIGARSKGAWFVAEYPEHFVRPTGRSIPSRLRVEFNLPPAQMRHLKRLTQKDVGRSATSGAARFGRGGFHNPRQYRLQCRHAI